MSNVLEIIPLGGLGEFGTNCLCLRYGDEMIVVDVGMGFPEETAYGVDVSVPDFDFLEEYRDSLLAIILTHGHEDHTVASFHGPDRAAHVHHVGHGELHRREVVRLPARGRERRAQ